MTREKKKKMIRERKGEGEKGEGGKRRKEGRRKEEKRKNWFWRTLCLGIRHKTAAPQPPLWGINVKFWLFYASQKGVYVKIFGRYAATLELKLRR